MIVDDALALASEMLAAGRAAQARGQETLDCVLSPDRWVLWRAVAADVQGALRIRLDVVPGERVA